MSYFGRIKQLFLSSSLLKDSVVYVFTDGVNKSIPFLLLPVISYYISPAEYGMITNYNLIVQILSIFCFSISMVVLPVVFFKLDEMEIRNYVTNMFVFNSVLTLICLVVLAMLNKVIENGVRVSYLYQIMSIISVWFASIIQLNMTLWRCEGKAFCFAAYKVFQSVIDCTITVLLIIVLTIGWIGRIYGMLIATVSLGFFSLILLYKRGYLSGKLSRACFISILSFSLPLIPHGLSFWLKSGVDKLMLTNICGMDMNGYYSVALTFGAIVSVIITSISNAFVPYLYKKLSMIDLDRENTIVEQKKIVKIIFLLLLSILLFVIISFLFSYYFIVLAYPISYFRSLEFLPGIMITQLFNGFYTMFVCFIHYTQKTKILGAITFLFSLFQIALGYYFIITIGAVGSVISSAIVALLTFVFVSIYAMKIYKLPWECLIIFYK